MSVMLAFLTARWLERLTDEEKTLLEDEFQRQNETRVKSRRCMPELSFYGWLGLSLFVPMPLLELGITCMLAGIYTYAWTQQPVVVASLVTAAGAVTLPFLIGVISIGREPERRRGVIKQLSKMQGDW